MSPVIVLLVFFGIGLNIQQVNTQNSSHYCAVDYYTNVRISYYRLVRCGEWGWSRCRRQFVSYAPVKRSNNSACCNGWGSTYCHVPICDGGCGYDGKCVAPDKCVCDIGVEGDRCQYHYNTTARCSILSATIEPQTFYPYTEKKQNDTRCWVVTGSRSSSQEEDDTYDAIDFVVKTDNITEWPDDCLRNSLQITAVYSNSTGNTPNNTVVGQEMCGRQSLWINKTDVNYMLIQIAAVSDYSDNATGVGIEYFIDTTFYDSEKVEHTTFAATTTTTDSTRVSSSAVFKENDFKYETSAWPNYGPEAGGTTIIIHGDYLPLISVVKLGDDIFCETLYRNDSMLFVVTPKLPEIANVIGKPLQIMLVTVPSSVWDTQHVFVYKENPVIEEVYPRETIREGGTQITVLGSNMDSVAVITMETTMILKELVQSQPPRFNLTSTVYETMCTIVNRTHVICLTPHIDLPPEFVSGSSRRRRATLRNNLSNFQSMAISTRPNMQSQNIDLLKELPMTKSRDKRNVKIDRSRDGDILEFFIGFYMDGVDQYHNYTTIDVFLGPEFHIDPIVHKYTKNKPLIFKGKHLDVGVTVHDYNITVGKEQCMRLELLSNSLSCYPPVEQPEIDEASDQNHPMIMIHVGIYIEHMAGYLSYAESTLPRYVIILAAVSITCAIVLIIVVAVVCASKRKKPT